MGLKSPARFILFILPQPKTLRLRVFVVKPAPNHHEDAKKRLARSTWWTQSSQIAQVLYHGRDGHAAKPS